MAKLTGQALSLELDPPLANLTRIPKDAGTISFTAILDLDKDESNGEPWETELWFGEDGQSEWRPARFMVVDDEAIASSLVKSLTEPLYAKRYIYKLDFRYTPSAKPLRFTLRTRPHASSPWIWARDLTGKRDGLIRIDDGGYGDFPEEFTDVFPDCKAEVTTLASDHSNFLASFKLEGVASPGTSRISLGKPEGIDEFYALIKRGNAWLEPQVDDKFKVSLRKDSVMLSMRTAKWIQVVVLGLVDRSGETVTHIESGEDGELFLVTHNSSNIDKSHLAVVSFGYSGNVVDVAFDAMKEIVTGYSDPTESRFGEPKDVPVGAKWYERWYDGLGFCTWNALGRELTEQRLLDALQDLDDSGIKINCLIIDDNWQSLIGRKWDSFEADSKAFPKGLKHTILTIRERFKNIQTILVWHAIFGYWDGIAPGGYIDRNYNCITLKWHGGHDVRIVHPNDINRLFRDFYRFLQDCQVSGVKCDVQASMSELDDLHWRTAVSNAYQSAFKLQSLVYFGRTVIYCMAMQPTVMQRSLLQTNMPAAVFRTSDDFFPDVPKSHLWHIYTNTMNAQYTSRLNIVPDWDMFQSTLPDFAQAHAIARALSTGPVYITDYPGKHEKKVIEGLAALHPNLSDWTACRLEKVDCMYPYDKLDSHFFTTIGIWWPSSTMAFFQLNASPGRRTKIISSREVVDTYKTHHPKKEAPKNPFVMTTRGSKPVLVHPGEDKLHTLTLDSNAIHLSVYTATYPIPPSPFNEYAYMSLIGLSQLYVPSAAITSLTFDMTAKRVTLTASFRAVGILDCFISDLEERTSGGEIKNLMVTLNGEPVEKESVRAEGDVLKVDMVRELKRGRVIMGNEVVVAISAWTVGIE